MNEMLLVNKFCSSDCTWQWVQVAAQIHKARNFCLNIHDHFHRRWMTFDKYKLEKQEDEIQKLKMQVFIHLESRYWITRVFVSESNEESRDTLLMAASNSC